MVIKSIADETLLATEHVVSESSKYEIVGTTGVLILRVIHAGKDVAEYADELIATKPHEHLPTITIPGDSANYRLIDKDQILAVLEEQK